MPDLLLATQNHGKIIEMQFLLKSLPIRLLTLNEVTHPVTVLEDGTTYAANACKKALEQAQQSGFFTLADDSGLEVNALNGEPGIRSARFSPLENANDEDRRKYLLAQLTGHPHPWKARFRCVVAIASPEQILAQYEGVCLGEIILQERGHNGFGYDPIFFLPEREKTMAELSSNVKNRISHRARAIQAAMPFLRELFQV